MTGNNYNFFRKGSNDVLFLYADKQQKVSHLQREQSYRVDRIRALGNAVVPQVVAEIFRALAAVEGM
jgi:hypothetical protein